MASLRYRIVFLVIRRCLVRWNHQQILILLVAELLVIVNIDGQPWWHRNLSLVIRWDLRFVI